MPRLRDVQTTFTRGELDPRLVGRTDTAARRNGADKLRNVMVQPQGGARRRPGSEYVDTVIKQLSQVDISSETWANPNGGTVANLYDGTSTTFQTTTGISTTDDYVVFELDFGVDTTLVFFDVLGLRLSGGSSSEEFAVEAQEDGGSWEVLRTIRLIDTTGRDLRFTPTKDYRKFRVIRNGTSDLGADTAIVAEVEAFTEGASCGCVRQLGFIFADDQRYLMVLTDYNMRVYRNTGGAETYQVDVPLPYPHTDVVDVTYAIDGDTIILFHNEYQTRSVQRQGDHDEWRPSAISFTNIPQYDFGSGNEDIWSTTRGWPRCGAFFQGRLCMGGSTERPSTFIASVSGSPYDLDDSTTDDNKAIHITLAPSGEEIPTIRHIVVGPHLVLMTSAGEYYVPKSIDTAITPTNTTMRLAQRAGMDTQRLVPLAIDGAIYFVQREGQSVRELIYSEVEQNYSANVVSLLSSHLIRVPIEQAFRRQLSTSDTNLMLYVNTDGSIAAFTLLRDQEIAAFTLWETRSGDKYIGAAAVKDDLYCATERDINSVTEQHIERFSFDVFMDDAVVGGAAASAAVAHLDTEEVAIVLDDAVQANQTVTSGSVTFARASTTEYQVGLPWPDVKALEDAHQLTYHGFVTTFADGESQVWVRLFPAPGQIGDGPLHNRRRRHPEILLDLFRTSECKVEGNRVPFRQFGGSLLDQAVPKFTGAKRVVGVLGWSRTEGIEVTQTEHQPFNLLAVTSAIYVD